MTVTFAERSITTGSGTTGPFDTPFEADAITDVGVVRVTIADGTKTAFALTTDYTATQNADKTWRITTVASLTSSYKLLLYPKGTPSQDDSISTGDFLAGSSIEEALDKIVRFCLALDDRLKKCVKVPIDDLLVPANLPKPESRLGMLLYFNATTGDIEAISIADLQTLLGL